jgi:SAM-dependent methyltransferase
MKDIVENRKRVGLARKLKVAALALRENGPLWCFHLLTYYTASTVAHRAFATMDRLRRTKDIPGLNSASLNKEIWEGWDWSAQGDEWNQSEDWKQSLIRNVLQRYVPADRSVLEIGPGGGRWTVSLLERAREYVGIDISATCVAHCKNRFGSNPHATFFVGSGCDLAEVVTGSVDAIWSFDAFVHINSAEVEGYVQEFARVLRPGGTAIIHHGAVGGSSGGWRSNLTATTMHEIVARHGLHIQQSLAQWHDGAQVHQLPFGDLITVITISPRDCIGTGADTLAG